MTLRVGDQLVGLRADSDATAATIRTMFGAWVDAAASLPGEQGAPDEPIPWAFSVRLHTDSSGRGPRAVPQLRIGRRLLARSRRPDDVMNALDHVLGGVLARQDDTRRWLGLRTFVAGDRAVLVDATPPALTADPRLTRAEVTELPAWSVAVDGDTVHVPPPLTATSAGPDAGADSAFALVGLVGLDACSHPAATDAGEHDADAGELDAEQHADHQAVHHPINPGALLARFAARHPSGEWFHTVEHLVENGRVHASIDRALAAEQIRRLLVADGPTG